MTTVVLFPLYGLVQSFFQGGCNFNFVLKATSGPDETEVALIGKKLDKNTQPALPICGMANVTIENDSAFMFQVEILKPKSEILQFCRENPCTISNNCFSSMSWSSCTPRTYNLVTNDYYHRGNHLTLISIANI